MCRDDQQLRLTATTVSSANMYSVQWRDQCHRSAARTHVHVGKRNRLVLRKMAVPVECASVSIHPIRLTKHRLLIGDAEPVQVLQYAFFVFGFASIEIEILNPYDHHALMVPTRPAVYPPGRRESSRTRSVQSAVRVSEMQVPGRRWSKPRHLPRFRRRCIAFLACPYCAFLTGEEGLSIITIPRMRLAYRSR